MHGLYFFIFVYMRIYFLPRLNKAFIHFIHFIHSFIHVFFVIKGETNLELLHKAGLKTETTRIFILLIIQSENIITKTNSTFSIIKSLPYSTPRLSLKVCGKLISRKLILRDAMQLRTRYLCKTNESQFAWRSRINQNIQENAISESKKKKNK